MSSRGAGDLSQSWRELRLTILSEVVPSQMIDGEQLLRFIDCLGSYGRLACGGIYRPVYSGAWVEATEQLTRWMEHAGMCVRRDAAGNLWGLIEGDSPLPSVVAGSHIDTVTGGGQLDGAYGVLAAIVAAAALQRCHGAPRRTLEVLAFCEEEGSRFSVSGWGCRAITGRIKPGEADGARDAEGVSIGDAMRGIGLDPGELPTAVRKPSEIAAYLELHVEQGGILEHMQVPIGVVTSIVGATKMQIEVTGRQDHAGTTPMSLRRDALVGASAMVVAIRGVAASIGDPAVATVGKLYIEPDQINVVPGFVRFTVDVRHAGREGQLELVRRIGEECEKVAEQHQLQVDVRVLRDSAPAPMHPDLINLLSATAQDAGVPYALMPSGAGHDAKGMSHICPAAMLFVPSVDGRSHCPEEHTEPRDLVRGAELLARALERLCY